MKQISLRMIVGLTALPLMGLSLPSASAQVSQTLWYNGDLAGQIALRNTITGTEDTRTFDDFEIPDGNGWHVTSVWSNNAFSAGGPPPVTRARWSIRSGMSEGFGGEIIATGMSPAVLSPTGRWPDVFFDLYDEYEVRVEDLSVDLSPGTYWLQVTPIGDTAYNSTTRGTNAVGATASTRGHSLFNRPSHDLNYTVEAYDFSMGAAGFERSSPSIPEPCSLTLVLLGLSLTVTVVPLRRRLAA